MSTWPAPPRPRVRLGVTIVLIATLLAPYLPLLLAIGPSSPSPTEDPSADDGPTGLYLIFALGFLLVGAAAATGAVLSLIGALNERFGGAAPGPDADDAVLRGEAPLQRWHRSVGLVLVTSVASFAAVELLAALAAIVRVPSAALWPLIVLPALTATVATFGIWWFVIMTRRRDAGLPASERGAVARGAGDLRALRRVAAPARLLPVVLAGAVIGFVVFVAAAVGTSTGGS